MMLTIIGQQVTKVYQLLINNKSKKINRNKEIMPNFVVK